MALINIDSDPWLDEYEFCNKLQREIMEQLSTRENVLKSSEQYSRLSASIHLRLKQFVTQVEQLKTKLDEESKSTSITLEEIERRRRQIELLNSKIIMMRKLYETNSFKDESNSKNRSELIGSNATYDLGTADWGVDEDMVSNINDNSIESIRDRQKLIAEEQNKGLEELSKIISRQKNIAQTMNNEVEYQNEIIDDLGEHIDRTDLRVKNETFNVQAVNRKDRTCGYWVVIILLLIAIIVVFVV